MCYAGFFFKYSESLPIRKVWWCLCLQKHCHLHVFFYITFVQYFFKMTFGSLYVGLSTKWGLNLIIYHI